ncbi:DNA polymerase, partial [Dysgonomonas sp. GY617]|uniref:DNA polymerase n=1 Tax=Dysgonomonas sp. GY617 TaxID=2780420 RepID=UPI00188389CA
SEFIKAEYNLSDIALKELDLAFIRKFDVFLKVEKNCAQNSAITRLKNLKKITRIAFSNDWMQKDPFVTYRFKFDETDPEFLTLYIDYTQFEAGILASLSEEDSLIRLYDSDIYLDFAKCILKNDNRQEAKIYFYRYMYGDTTLNPTILKYFNKYTKLKKFHELIETELIENKKIGTCDGNFRLILEEDNYHWALSHKIQATASLIFKQALIKVEKEVPEADFLIPMHDGAVYQVDLARYNLSKIKIEKIFTDSFKKICPNIIPRVHTQSTFE